MEEEIKKCWQETSFRTVEPTGGSPRRKTALQALIARYRRFSYLSLICVLGLMPCFVHFLGQWTETKGWTVYGLDAFMGVYFILACIMDRWLANGLSSINIAEMPVAEVCGRIFYYRKKHLQFMAVLIPMAVVFIGWLAWICAKDTSILMGMIVGAVAGGCLGYNAFCHFMKEYREATAE